MSEIGVASAQGVHQDRQRGAHGDRGCEQHHEGREEARRLDQPRHRQQRTKQRRQRRAQERQDGNQADADDRDRDLQARHRTQRRPQSRRPPRGERIAERHAGHEARQHQRARPDAVAERQARAPEPQGLEDEGGRSGSKEQCGGESNRRGHRAPAGGPVRSVRARRRGRLSPVPAGAPPRRGDRPRGCAARSGTR